MNPLRFGDPVLTGRFSDGMERLRIARRALRRSVLITALMTYAESIQIGEPEIRLHDAVVERSQALFEARCPGSEFHVVMWDDASDRSDAVLDELYRRSLRVHLVRATFSQVTPHRPKPTS